jgi:endonuclease G
MHALEKRKKKRLLLLAPVFFLWGCMAVPPGPGYSDQELLPSLDGCGQFVQHKAYSLCYSETDEQARWVFYRLTKAMCGTNAVKRNDRFIPDPMVATGSAETGDYKNSGFDRGHLCPAGDMNWSEETMQESFYMSNMSPQLHAFNAGIWEKLEGRVRKWAEGKGEVVVITGGILKPGLQKIGEKNKVSVPDHFFKIIYSGNNGPSAIGFVIPNGPCPGKSYLDFAMTVDSVEKLTGIDFFPRMSDSIEQPMEAKFSRAEWLDK